MSPIIWQHVQLVLISSRSRCLELSRLLLLRDNVDTLWQLKIPVQLKMRIMSVISEFITLSHFVSFVKSVVVNTAEVYGFSDDKMAEQLRIISP